MEVISRLAGTVFLAGALFRTWPMPPGFEHYALNVIAGLGWTAAWFGADYDAWVHLGEDQSIRLVGLAALVGVLLYTLF